MNTKKINKINDSIDFWKAANEFLNAQLPKDFEDKLKEFVEKNNYNQNELRLFKSMLESAVGFKATMLLLKSFSSNPEKKK